MGSVQFQSRAWDFAERAANNQKWVVNATTGAGQWTRIGDGLNPTFVSNARARLSALVDGSPRTIVSSSSVPNAGALAPDPVASVVDLSPNDIGKVGEEVVRRALLANGEIPIRTATITVRLSTGEVFDVVPDFFRVASEDGATVTLDIIESKASRNALPDLRNLSDNQAVLLDALLRGDDLTITPSSTLLRELPNGVDRVVIGRFDIQTFLLR